MITIKETFSGPRVWGLSGKYFKLLSSGQPVDIKFFTDGSGPAKSADQVSLGFFARIAEGFERVMITAVGGGDTVSFFISDDEGGYDPFTKVTFVPPSQLGSVADVALNNGAPTVVLAADGTRQFAIIGSLGANTVPIRIGDAANVGAARGVELNPGEKITIQGTQAISAFAAAVGQLLSVTTINT